jgi:hypothetical protein
MAVATPRSGIPAQNDPECKNTNGENQAAQKTEEHCGGALEDKIPDERAEDGWTDCEEDFAPSARALSPRKVILGSAAMWARNKVGGHHSTAPVTERVGHSR